jgi:hypothetical protein
LYIILFAGSSEIRIDTDFWISAVKYFKNDFGLFERVVNVGYVLFGEIVSAFGEVDRFIFHGYQSEFGSINRLDGGLRFGGKTFFELLEHLVFEREEVWKHVSVGIF